MHNPSRRGKEKTQIAKGKFDVLHIFIERTLNEATTWLWYGKKYAFYVSFIYMDAWLLLKAGWAAGDSAQRKRRPPWEPPFLRPADRAAG
jgi:hypothetical protein